MDVASHDGNRTTCPDGQRTSKASVAVGNTVSGINAGRDFFPELELMAAVDAAASRIRSSRLQS